MENISEKVKSTPAARRIAKEYGIDIDVAFAANVSKRIDIDDVEEYAKVNMLKKNSMEFFEDKSNPDIAFYADDPILTVGIEPIFGVNKTLKKENEKMPQNSFARIKLPHDTIDAVLYSFSHEHDKTSVVLKAFSQALSKNQSPILSSSIKILEYSQNEGFLEYYISNANQYKITELCEKINCDEVLTNITFYNLLCSNIDGFYEDLKNDSMAIYAFMNEEAIIIEIHCKADFLDRTSFICVAASFKEYMLNPSLMLL